MENQGSWSCDANGAVNISLVQPGVEKLQTLSSFHPQFTYPIFGNEETIFGYKGLIIRLRFAVHDLKSNVHISYDEKFRTVEDIAALDLDKTLRPWIPEASFAPLAEFEQSVLNDGSARDFQPPGKLVHNYTSNQRNYEIWAGSLSDPDVRSLLDRIQIFVSFFIEAGTPIATDDFEWTLERWTVYFVYEKVEPPTPAASSYSLVGYATTYRWYFYHKSAAEQSQVSNAPFPFQPVAISQIPSRLRISQFLILPPHQLSGHGSHLYRAIHSASLSDPTIYELTVEDPNEAFDALRDTNDYHTLRPEFAKRGVSINPSPYTNDPGRRRPRLVPTSLLIPTDLLRELRTKHKIAPTQFAHILEMYLLSQIPESHRGSKNPNMSRLIVQKSRAPNENDRRYYWWRMLVKQRLYKRHRDTLIQIDKGERVQKLDETLQNVEEGYENLLKAFGAREESRKGEEQQGEEEGPNADANGVAQEGRERRSGERTKRKYVVFEADDDDDGDDDGGDLHGDGHGPERENGNDENYPEDQVTKKMKV